MDGKERRQLTHTERDECQMLIKRWTIKGVEANSPSANDITSMTCFTSHEFICFRIRAALRVYVNHHHRYLYVITEIKHRYKYIHKMMLNNMSFNGIYTTQAINYLHTHTMSVLVQEEDKVFNDALRLLILEEGQSSQGIDSLIHEVVNRSKIGKIKDMLDRLLKGFSVGTVISGAIAGIVISILSAAAVTLSLTGIGLIVGVVLTIIATSVAISMFQPQEPVITVKFKASDMPIMTEVECTDKDQDVSSQHIINIIDSKRWIAIVDYCSGWIILYYNCEQITDTGVTITTIKPGFVALANFSALRALETLCANDDNTCLSQTYYHADGRDVYSTNSPHPNKTYRSASWGFNSGINRANKRNDTVLRRVNPITTGITIDGFKRFLKDTLGDNNETERYYGKCWTIAFGEVKTNDEAIMLGIAPYALASPADMMGICAAVRKDHIRVRFRTIENSGIHKYNQSWSCGHVIGNIDNSYRMEKRKAKSCQAVQVLVSNNSSFNRLTIWGMHRARSTSAKDNATINNTETSIISCMKLHNAFNDSQNNMIFQRLQQCNEAIYNKMPWIAARIACIKCTEEKHCISDTLTGLYAVSFIIVCITAYKCDDDIIINYSEAKEIIEIVLSQKLLSNIIQWPAIIDEDQSIKDKQKIFKLLFDAVVNWNNQNEGRCKQLWSTEILPLLNTMDDLR